MSTRRQMLHLVPRDGASELSAAVALATKERPVVWLERMADGLATPDVAYACSIETSPPATATLEALVDELVGLIDLAASVALEGEDLTFVGGPPTPIRYQYLMRRRPDFDHDSYLARYRDVHSQFGIATPGIAGYTQFHVDPVASARLAAGLRFGTTDIDSVSELHLESLDKFFGALADSEVGAAVTADEELFVDRARSAMYTSVVHTG